MERCVASQVMLAVVERCRHGFQAQLHARVQRADAAQVVVKSQILAGGRGLGKFTNGFQGGVHIVHKDKARVSSACHG